MRRYWYRIDYNDLKNQKPHKPMEFYETTEEKTSFFDYDFTGYSESAVKFIIRQRQKSRTRSLFLESNYIKKKKGKRRSYQNRSFDLKKNTKFIYYLYFLYYQMDSFLYSYQLFFGYFGDKTFRKIVRKFSGFKFFILFRFFCLYLLYFFIQLPLKYFYKIIHFFFFYILYKNVWCRIKSLLFYFFKFNSFINDFFIAYYNRKVSKKTHMKIKTYLNMYFYTYQQYYRNLRKFLMSCRHNKLYFLYEMQELYFYFVRFSFTTWVVEVYYIIYNIIFLFYPFVIPVFFLLPFILLGQILYVFYIKNIYIVVFFVLFLFVTIIFLIFYFICVEITKYYLVNFSLEPINWDMLDIISKISAIYNSYRLFFREVKVSKSTQIRRNIRFFNYHELTMTQPIILFENNEYSKQDKNRGLSFFKKSRLYPHLPPRHWSQFGKCSYFDMILGFHFIENLFAGISKLHVFEYKNLNLLRIPLLFLQKRLTMFEFFLFFYNLVFSLFYFCLSKVFCYLIFYFNFTRNIKYFYNLVRNLLFWSFGIFLFFFLIPKSIILWFKLFFLSNFKDFIFLLIKMIFYQSVYFFLGLVFIYLILAWYTYNKNYVVISQTFTFHIFVIDCINFILFLFLIIMVLKLIFFFIFFCCSFFVAWDFLIAHPFCISYFKDIIYNLI